MAPRKPKKSEPTPPSIQGVDWNGSLADYKQSTVGNVKPGGTKVVTENRGPDTGMFAGSGTPLNSSIGMQDTSRKNVTNVIKNLAIQEVGGAALAKGVGLGIKSAINSGIPARVSNIIKGETVLVHGSPVKGLKEIKPFVSNNVISNEYPGKAAVFGYKPNELKDVRRLRYDVSVYTKVDSKIADDATIYITKVKKTGTAPAKNLVPKGVTTLPGSYAGSTPLKVVDSIAMQNKPFDIIEKELLSKIKKAGGKISKAPPATTRRA